MKQKKQNVVVNPKQVPLPEKKIKQSRFWISLVPLSVFFLATVVFYWPILSCQGFLWNDFLEQNYVYRLFAAVSLKLGIIPFWNPYVFSGMPFFADVQAAVFYPLNLVLTLFASREWLSPVLVEYQVIFHVFLAGCFMYLLARDLGISKRGAIVSGLTFMFCGFFSTHIFHMNLIHAAAWFPLIIFLFKRSIERISLLYMALTSLCLSIVFYCGYPQLLVHMYYWLAAFYCFGLILRLRQKVKIALELRRGLLFGICVALSIGISSVQMRTTQELAQNSVRPKLEFAQSCEGSFRPYRFITMIVPNYFGQPQKNAYWGMSQNDENPGMHNYWETAIYTGVIPLVCAVIAPFFIRTPFVFFLSGMGIISLLLAMGNSFFLYGVAYNFMPAMNAFRIPGRFAYMFSISIALLSGFFITWLQRDALQENAKSRTVLIKFLLAIAGFFLVIGFLYLAGFFKNGIIDFMISSGRFGSGGPDLSAYVDKNIYPSILAGVWIFCILLAMCVTILFFRLQGKLSGRNTVLLLTIITYGDFLLFAYGFSAGKIDPSVMYEKTSIVSQLQQLGMGEYFRINARDSNPGTEDLGGPNMVFRKNQGSVHRLFLMEGYNPLRLKRQLVNRNPRTLDILNVKYAIETDQKRGTMGLALRDTYFPRCRMVFDYSVVREEKNILPLLYDSSFDYKRKVILEEAPGFKPDTAKMDSGWNCSISNYSLNSIQMNVTTPKNGLLVLSEIHFPAWKALVDNKPVPVYRADYALRAIPVEKGQHSVLCYYSTDVFNKGMIISMVSIIITLFFGIVGFVRKSQKKQ